MFKVLVDYPSYDEELVVVQRVTGPAIELKTLLCPSDVLELQRQADQAYVDPRVVAYAAMLVQARVAEPPVASIGSSRRTCRPGIGGSFS